MKKEQAREIKGEKAERRTNMQKKRKVKRPKETLGGRRK